MTTQTDLLATLGRGFADPVDAAQRCFRALLDAMSYPGRIQSLDARALSGLQPPPASAGQPDWQPATGALALALLDVESPLHLGASMDSPAARTWLRFHTGVVVAAGAEAGVAIARPEDLSGTFLAALPQGTDEVPQDGATLVIEVPGLDEVEALPGAQLLSLQGPGIEQRQSLAVQGLAPDFWRWRQALERGYPCGIDLVLCCGTRLAALPRTTRITWEG